MKKFPHYVSMPIQEVMNNPTEYIIPENLKAIEYLWDMNIITTQTNDYENEDSWITFRGLSPENEEIITKLRNDVQWLDESKPGICNHHGVGFRIPIKPGIMDTFPYFKELFKLLKYQDVQKEGYMTIEEFYCNYTDCFKVVKNPYLGQDPKPEDFDSIDEYLKKANEFVRLYPNTPTIKVFDPSKTKKSLEEYLEENGLLDCYDAEEGKVFYCRRLYEGHIKYKELTKSKAL